VETWLRGAGSRVCLALLARVVQTAFANQTIVLQNACAVARAVSYAVVLGQVGREDIDELFDLK
jgi:hypothetical protein